MFVRSIALNCADRVRDQVISRADTSARDVFFDAVLLPELYKRLRRCQDHCRGAHVRFDGDDVIKRSVLFARI